MADNIPITAGEGTTVATDDISSVHYQIVKVGWGALDTINILDAASGKALPMQGEAADNAAATGNPVRIGGLYEDSPTTRGDGDVVTVGTSATGAMRVTMEDASGSAIASAAIAEDAAFGSGGTVIMAGVVRKDAFGSDVGASGDATVLHVDAEAGALRVQTSEHYDTVAASQTSGQTLETTTGAAGDYLEKLVIVPTSVSPQEISIADGTGSDIVIFAGGTDSLATLHPFTVPIGAYSVNGAWSVTTGTGATVIATGRF